VELGLSGLLGLSTPVRAAGAAPQGLYGSALPALQLRVAPRVAALYRGQYLLTASAPTARLSSGTLHIDVDAAGSLIGVMALYGYDARGYQFALTFTAPGVYHYVCLIPSAVPASRAPLVVERGPWPGRH